MTTTTNTNYTQTIKSINDPTLLTNFAEKEYDNYALSTSVGDELDLGGGGLQLPANDHKWNGSFSLHKGFTLNLSWRKDNQDNDYDVQDFLLDMATHTLHYKYTSNPPPPPHLAVWEFDFADAIDYDTRWATFDGWYCDQLTERFGNWYCVKNLTLKGAYLCFSKLDLEEEYLFEELENDGDAVCVDDDWSLLMGYLLYSAEQGQKNLRHDEFGKKDAHYDKSVLVNKRIAELKQVGLTQEQIDPILKSEGLVAVKTGGGAKGKPRGKDGSFAYTKKKPREFNNQKCPSLTAPQRLQKETSVHKGMVVKFGKPTDKASIGYMIAERDCKEGDKAIRGLCMYWNGKVDYAGKWVRVYLEQVQSTHNKAGFVNSQKEQADKGRGTFETWNKLLSAEEDFKDALFSVPVEEEVVTETEEEVPTAEEETPKKKPRGRPKKKVEA